MDTTWERIQGDVRDSSEEGCEMDLWSQMRQEPLPHHEDCHLRLGLPIVEQQHYLLLCFQITNNEDCIRFNKLTTLYFTFNNSVIWCESFQLNVLPSSILMHHFVEQSSSRHHHKQPISPCFIITNSPSPPVSKNILLLMFDSAITDIDGSMQPGEQIERC